ncbi:MAG: hypothetical protein FJW40_27360 [Acidobacteria bacterium]|nr:hypothetical protein [Acidobacteriota bacterium]
MQRRWLPFLIAGGLAGTVALREWPGLTRAAARDTTAWGATDPTWSPDGQRLACTLFGSIWTVPAAGGTARQVTRGPGYHAHPAWSPKGGRIAYIQGAPPAGVLPNIAGRLAVFDEATMEERVFTLPYTTAGTPAWSPDGATVAVPLNVPETGALLHLVNIADGAARAIQQPPQRGRTGNWLYTTWNGAKNEIFYTGQRFNAVQNGTQTLGAPQVYSLPGAPGPIMIQLPWTQYRLGHIVQPHAVTTTPDGNAAIYSAVVVNGKGDRELYRVARGNSTPVALTNTPRDEFSPALSPDGSTIAFSSNERGNLDLYTMPAAGGARRHVSIGDLAFRNGRSTLRIKTTDETGAASPVRLYLKASDGKTYAPKGAPVFYYMLEPGQPREGFFITTGEDEVVLPPGPVRLVAVKGIEYRIDERTLNLEAGSNEVTIAMERWTNWNQRGWYTGENHFHANYNGSYYQKPPDSLDWLLAEDLNAANMIVANSEGAFIHDKEFFRGAVDPVSKPRFLLYWGQEFRNSNPLGHMAFLINECISR